MSKEVSSTKSSSSGELIHKEPSSGRPNTSLGWGYATRDSGRGSVEPTTVIQGIDSLSRARAWDLLKNGCDPHSPMMVQLAQ